MRRKNINIATIVVLLLGAVGYFYLTNDKVKAGTDHLVNEYVLGKKATPETVVSEKPLSPTWLYEIVDATDIEDKQFAIPKIDTVHISRLIDWQYRHGGGKYSLTYIDNYSKDNDVKYLTVPEPAHCDPAPVQKEGEVSYEYFNQKTAYEKYLQKFIADSMADARQFFMEKQQFLNDCYAFLNNTVYVVGSPTHRRTDAVGGLNACFSSMKVSPDSLQKFLIAFSDLEDNVGGKLKPKPVDISVIVVNPVPSSTKKILGEVPEVQVPSEVLERIQKLTQNHNR